MDRSTSGRLNNKVAVITGSTTGIGAAMATRFAAEGASVMVHGRNEIEAQHVVENIRGAGGQAEYHLGDLADPAECRQLVESVVALCGRIDILVNNAAFVTRGDIDDTDTNMFDRTMAVNARAPMLLIQSALPHFRSQKSGAVLNIGSVNGYCGERNQLAYSMSKGALMTMSRNLSDALGSDGIRVNHFNVGWVLTKNEFNLKISEGLPTNWPDTLDKSVAPSGRLLSPEEIANFAVSFVEDAGGFVTGAVVELEQYPMIGRNPPK